MQKWYILSPPTAFVFLVQGFDFAYLLQTGSMNKCLKQHKIEYGVSQNISKDQVNIARGLLKVVKLTFQTHWNIRGFQILVGRYSKGSTVSNKTASEKATPSETQKHAY